VIAPTGIDRERESRDGTKGWSLIVSSIGSDHASVALALLRGMAFPSPRPCYKRGQT
jgi:hypothetical protein